MKLKSDMRKYLEFLFDVLEKENLVNSDYHYIDPKTTLIMYRHTFDLMMLRKKELILETDPKKYEESMKVFGFNMYDYWFDLIRHSTSYVLGDYEFLKRILRDAIYLNKLGLRKTSTFGEIIEKIGNLKGINKSQLKITFNTAFRDILAHESWWVEGKKMCYQTKNGKIEKLDYEDLKAEEFWISALLEGIQLIYLERYRPEKLRDYQNRVETLTGGFYNPLSER